MFHLYHVEGVVGPASFLIKLDVSSQIFESHLKTEPDTEQWKRRTYKSQVVLRGNFGAFDGICVWFAELRLTLKAMCS